MELRHLRYFVAVAEARHFGQAAKRLQMAQPPLSQAIRRLETELGVELLIRTTRRVQLTPAGATFYDDAVRMLSLAEESVRRVGHYAEGRHGVLRVGVTGSAAFSELPRIARVVERDLPGVALEVAPELLTRAQEQALVESQIDVGVLRPPVFAPQLSCRLLDRTGFLLALPERHRLAGEAVVDLAALAGESFVTYPQASQSVVNDAVVRSCHAAGFTPRREHEAAETSTLLALVAAGLGVALVPESVRVLRLDGVVYTAVTGTEILGLGLAWRTADDSPLLARFLAALDADRPFLSDDSTDGGTGASMRVAS
jgi:DNA-binding transcriptional LysR family regulator